MSAQDVLIWLRRQTKSRFVRFGLPFLTMIVGGSFGLKYFASLRYEFSRRKMITHEEADQYGVKMKKEKSSIEDTYQKMKEEDIDTWQNVRGPRPWEDSKTIQAELRSGQATNASS
ncbi:cytochrome c oxidase assembly protein COX16 homolog, mitochondrial-like [Lineus longissimus]|uniref:cytochrome c oxidase assembly protein COX16 homolog, mitochondrial-like n=1 Tax=Lineus longissimus TaxID=88925 RepID=UPI002B4F9631